MLTDGKGIPLALHVDGANRNDFKLVPQTLRNIVIKRPKPTRKNKQHMCMDKGYDYTEVRELVKQFGFTAHIPVREKKNKKKLKKLKHKAWKKARRWVVERTHSWLNRFRRILVRWEKKTETYLAMLHLACGVITWRATGLLR